MRGNSIVVRLISVKEYDALNFNVRKDEFIFIEVEEVIYSTRTSINDNNCLD